MSIPLQTVLTQPILIVMNIIRHNHCSTHFWKVLLGTVFVSLIILLTACAQEEMNESIGYLTDADINNIHIEYGSSGTAIILDSKLEYDYLGETTTYSGYQVVGENIDLDEVQLVFKRDLAKSGATKIDLRFETEVPQKVIWRQFYIDSKGEYRLLSNDSSQEIEVNEYTATVSIGSNMAKIVDSSVRNTRVFRIIHIICYYENVIKAYDIILG